LFQPKLFEAGNPDIDKEQIFIQYKTQKPEKKAAKSTSTNARWVMEFLTSGHKITLMQYKIFI
jgi:hypothetical protein